MTIRVYPYRQRSRSANRLARILGGTVLKTEGVTIVPNSWDIVINWGASKCPSAYTEGSHRVVNPPSAIARASNKRSAFLTMSAAGVSIPKFSTSIPDIDWEGLTVVRHKLTGHSGEGIELVAQGAELPAAPLYVEYVPKKDEYRVHVMGESIILVQRKGARSDYEGKPDFQIRNHKNGFVFVRNDVSPDERVLDEARKAIKALGLDFGAVDIVWNQSRQKAYVLEVNTAPGMEGSTIGDYAEAFRDYLDLRPKPSMGMPT